MRTQLETLTLAEYLARYESMKDATFDMVGYLLSHLASADETDCEQYRCLLRLAEPLIIRERERRLKEAERRARVRDRHGHRAAPMTK